jgi:hypothetical protein
MTTELKTADEALAAIRRWSEANPTLDAALDVTANVADDAIADLVALAGGGPRSGDDSGPATWDNARHAICSAFQLGACLAWRTAWVNELPNPWREPLPPLLDEAMDPMAGDAGGAG